MQIKIMRIKIIIKLTVSRKELITGALATNMVFLPNSKINMMKLIRSQ